MSRLTVVMIVISAVLVFREPLSAAPPVRAMTTRTAMPTRTPGPTRQANQNRRQQPQRIIHDIQLKSNNTFRGRLPADLLARLKRKAGIWVRFYDRKNHMIAETKTDRLGRFSLYYLPTGTGTLMVGSGQTAKVCFCRLWAPGTAPPAVNHQTRTAAQSSRSVSRGQNLHAFPTMSFKEVATAVGVVGGAVATPIIWHNIQEDHKAPVSGS